MAKRKIVIGNWKMNPSTGKVAAKLFVSVIKSLPRVKKTEVVVCPPTIYLERLTKIRTSKITLGGQNAFWGEVGAFTGEVSGNMLYEAGAKYVILGHSERRALGETNELINKKIKSALASGLTPIVCVGEKVRDESHKYFDIVKNDVKECLSGVSKASFSEIIIAYEPVWALSSTADRHDATASDSREMAVFIRKTLSDISSPEIATKTRIIYGGSVNEKDAYEFLQNGGVDGVLPGRASLDGDKFAEIVRIAESIK